MKLIHTNLLPSIRFNFRGLQCLSNNSLPTALLAGFWFIGLTLGTTGCGEPAAPVTPDVAQHDHHSHDGPHDHSSPDHGDDNGVDNGKLKQTDLMVRRIVQSEELIQALSGSLALLTKGLENGELSKADFVAPKIELLGLDPEFDPFAQWNEKKDPTFYSVDWPIAKQSNAEVDASLIWQPLSQRLKMAKSKFGVLGGHFNDSEDQFTMKISADGHLEPLAAGNDLPCSAIGFSGKHELHWTKDADNDWRLTGWTQIDFSLTATEQPMFKDVTQQAIPDDDLRKRSTRSLHEELIIDQLESGSITAPRLEWKEFTDWESSNHYPSTSVIDIDNDGWDDLFLVDRWDEVIFLRNKGDGTFEDITESTGLGVVKELANCAVFADFDNDGDSDVFVGRTRVPSMYFINDGGVFKPHKPTNELIAGSLSMVSGSAVDVNRDGLLDLYICTYGYGTGPVENWVDQVVKSRADQNGMRFRIEGRSAYLDRGGPPNVLLMNTGDGFERVFIDNELKQWRNSYQAAWSDFDNDGDPDLYVANDFSPDAFLRNDTEAGSNEVKFTDITKEYVTDGSIGFGMGVSWGDYNNDANLDLYVSNMFSKAGMRIVSQLDQVDPRIEVSARGNFLYQNDGKTFTQVAGLDGDSQKVSKVGWSFGGQFADFDNDGNLDLYVPSGYFSAPQTVATTTDL